MTARRGAAKSLATSSQHRRAVAQAHFALRLRPEIPAGEAGQDEEKRPCAGPRYRDTRSGRRRYLPINTPGSSPCSEQSRGTAPRDSSAGITTASPAMHGTPHLLAILRRELATAGFTLGDVASALGTSEQRAATLMANGTMKLRDIDKLVELLHLDFDEILSEVGYPRPVGAPLALSASVSSRVEEE